LYLRLATILTISLLLLTSCGGGGSSGSGTPPPPGGGGGGGGPTDPVISVAEAHRFLRQASFGPTPTEVEKVRDIGFEAWIDQQLLEPVSLQLPYMDDLPEPENSREGQTNRLDAWFQNVLNGKDQLRQRVAFALSEIIVISDQGNLFNFPNGLADYYDKLAINAFANYPDLLKTVTLTPAMGRYLSMLGNQKPDKAKNIRPDENYAREVMQLFSIGLVMLNKDGSVVLDQDNQPIPTYDQAVIEAFAHVFTGWTFYGSEAFNRPSYIFRAPMVAFQAYHDEGEKRLLNDVILPAGQSAEDDLDAALGNITNHANVPPFISRQLIQRLVTANPSPDYIERVADVFIDDGFGTRGNLGAVVKTILLDPDARAEPTDDTSGKLTEPLLRLTAIWRVFNASAESDRYLFAFPEYSFSQAPLRADSVFNFFRPDFAPTGEIGKLGLVSPEMQITNETTSVLVNNYLALVIFLQHSSVTEKEVDTIYINIDAELAIADQPEALVDQVAEKLLGGNISDALRAESLAMMQRWDSQEGKVAETIYTIATSPEFAVLP
jgi:uncharacterized protein (DUF1800 family)